MPVNAAGQQKLGEGEKSRCKAGAINRTSLTSHITHVSSNSSKLNS
jgi:hypothetical protein